MYFFLLLFLFFSSFTPLLSTVTKLYYMYLLSFEAFNDIMYKTNMVSFYCSPGSGNLDSLFVEESKNKNKKLIFFTDTSWSKANFFSFFLNTSLIVSLNAPVVTHNFDIPSSSKPKYSLKIIVTITAVLAFI